MLGGATVALKSPNALKGPTPLLINQVGILQEIREEMSSKVLEKFNEGKKHLDTEKNT